MRLYRTLCIQLGIEPMIEDCPASVGRIQSDNLPATPHPVSPHSASTLASAPTSLLCEDESRLHVNIWSEDKKKTVEIATVQEKSWESSRVHGVEDKVRVVKQVVVNNLFLPPGPISLHIFSRIPYLNILSL